MPQIVARASGINLREVLPQGRLIGGTDVRVTSCCSDSRNCQPGDVFVALTGISQDGHDFAQQAVARGAVAVIAERLLPVSVPTLIVSDTREAYGRLCQVLAGLPAEQMRMVGVSGTNGKTTTSLLIASVLQAAGQHVGHTTSLGFCDAATRGPATDATPSAPELATWLARMAANGCGSAVMELSSLALAQRRAAGIGFDAAVLTNLRRDHLDFHGSVRNYRRVKARLFRQLKPNGFAVLNADDAASQELLTRLDHPTITVGMRSVAEVTATVVQRHRSEQVFLLNAGNETIPVRTRMIGDQHVYNCLAATAVGLVLGLDLTTVVAGLEAVRSLPARLERLECGQSFGVYVDCAETPDTLAMALKTLRQVTSGRVICVFSSSAQRDLQQYPLLGRVAERGADVGLLTSAPGSRNSQAIEIVHEILDGYDRPSRAHLLPDRRQAVEWALSSARPGDSVLIAGSQPPADDAGHARQWLYRNAEQLCEINAAIRF